MKRIISILLIGLILTIGALPAFAAGSTSFKMTADSTDVSPGDTVTYTVSLGAVEDLYSLKLKIVIPEGLTYVAGSGKIAEGLEVTMNAAKCEFVEESMVLIVGSCAYSSEFETELLQFQCSVDADTSGLKVVHFEIDPENVFDMEYDNIDYTVTSAAVSVDEPCDHEWVNADCTTPKSCKLCGVVDGTVSEHQWQDPQADGEDGHWYDCANCTLSRLEEHIDQDENGACDVCGYTSPEDSGNVILWIVLAVGLLGAGAATVVILKKKKKQKWGR